MRKGEEETGVMPGGGELLQKQITRLGIGVQRVAEILPAGSYASHHYYALWEILYDINDKTKQHLVTH